MRICAVGLHNGIPSLLSKRRLPAFEHTQLAIPKTAFLTGGGAKSGAPDARRNFAIHIHPKSLPKMVRLFTLNCFL
jgi:hypothetical protein